MTGSAPGPRTVLVVHPGAELYGSDRVMLESVAGFVDAGWRVVVALGGRGPLVAELEAVGARTTVATSPVLRKSALRPLGMLRLIADTLVGAVRGLTVLHRVRPDAVYVSTVTIPLWVLLARLTRVPVVCHVHEGEASASRTIRRMIAAPLHGAQVVVANSEFSVGVLRSAWAALGDRAVVVANAVPGPAAVVPARDVLTDPMRVLYVGRLSPRKGVDVVVDAVLALRAQGMDVRLDLVGDVFTGYEWYEDELRERAGRTEAGAVHLHGFRTDVPDFLARADVVVVPSRVDEPFGNTAVEAVLAARPLVVSDTSGLREAARGYRCATQVAPGSVDELTAALRSVHDRWSELRSAALEDAAVAAERHDPLTYRRAITDQLERAVRFRR